MIETVQTADGTIATLGTLLVSLGFEAHPTVSGGYYWGNDTNKKVYLYIYTSGSNTAIAIRNSSNTAISSVFQAASASAWKITYCILGDSIIIGSKLTTNTGCGMYWGFIAPKTQNDDWMCFYPQGGTVMNMKTQTAIANGVCYTGSASGVQIVKAYDGARFTDNLYLAVMHPSLSAWSDTAGNNYAIAEIDNKEYLLVNNGNTAVNAPLFATEIPASN